MTNKLCDLKKLCGKSTKIGDTPLLYIKEKIVPEFCGKNTYETIQLLKKEISR